MTDLLNTLYKMSATKTPKSNTDSGGIFLKEVKQMSYSSFMIL